MKLFYNDIFMQLLHKEGGRRQLSQQVSLMVNGKPNTIGYPGTFTHKTKRSLQKMIQKTSKNEMSARVSDRSDMS